VSGTRQVIAKEGASALLTGFGPTAVGYFVQGGAKFAGYELWKSKFVEIAGDQQTAVKYRTAIYLGAATVAEYVSQRPYQNCFIKLVLSFRFFADILLTPLEATRIRLVSQRGYATGLVSGFTRLAREGGLRELYAGFLPILCKSVPSVASSSYVLPHDSFPLLDRSPTQLANSPSTSSVMKQCIAICPKKPSAR
jgi:solute carrier family 25 phosphate transporter 3